MKRYGLYLGYGPQVELLNEGLGRQLVAFLKAACAHESHEWIVACPSWLEQPLRQLCASEGVDPRRLRIVCPAPEPAVLRLDRRYQAWLARLRRHDRAPTGASLTQRWRQWGREHLANTRRVPVMLAIAALGGLLLAALKLARLVRALPRRVLAVMARGISLPGPHLLQKYFGRMAEHELRALGELVNSLAQVRAWYSPAAFWPEFNAIRAPRVICVPDVVLTSFSTGFALLNDPNTPRHLARVEQAIRQGTHFVTYSETIKWDTLIAQYGAVARNVTVVRHAPQSLAHWVEVTGFEDARAASLSYCRSLLLQAMHRSATDAYLGGFANGAVEFIFYPSQYRPSKNMPALVRAHAHLLRSRQRGIKLVLTIQPKLAPELIDLIRALRLEREVLLLPALSSAELAALYRLARLAVNPSLAEGGCPFTFSEALSVGTPVSMARISVTMEELDTPELPPDMFFDPYDWRDMARSIEWCLNHRDALLAAQLPVYQRQCARTWTTVVDETVAALERAAEAHAAAGTAGAVAAPGEEANPPDAGHGGPA